MSLFGKLLHHRCHPIKKEYFSIFLIAVAGRCSNQFLRLRNSKRGKNTWENGP